MPRPGVVPKFSDLEVVALGLAAEALGIDSESLLFSRLEGYRREMPRLLSRRQYNDRRKSTTLLCQRIRERMAREMDGDEDCFCIDSMPVAVCRMARAGRCTMGRKDTEKASSYGYCAAQGAHFYGFKLHAVCGLNGVIPSFDLTRASVHDLHYLKDVKADFSDCTLLGDKGYISAQVQLDLFESARIRMEVPCRKNQRDRNPAFRPFAKARKRMETVFSQLYDLFMPCAITQKTPRVCSPGLSGKSAPSPSYNTLTTKTTSPSAGASMRCLNSANG